MRSMPPALQLALRLTSYVLGVSVLALALAMAAWSIEPETIIGWALDILSPGFVGLLGALLLGAAYCLFRMLMEGEEEAAADFWLNAGLQLANGVATLALTFTLFGISVGIGSLAHQGLTPETVNGVIREVTESFSLAFATTVVGLPLSAALRALLVVAHGRRRLTETRMQRSNKADQQTAGEKAHEVPSV